MFLGKSRHLFRCFRDFFLEIKIIRDNFGPNFFDPGWVYMIQVRNITVHTNWLKSFGMICNSSKTELITFGGQYVKVEVDNVEINSIRCVKILGILIHDRLSWEDHICTVIRKCKSHIFALRYIRTFLNVNDTFRILRAHLVTVLTYGSPVWSHAL